jgi:hypothetical protein
MINNPCKSVESVSSVCYKSREAGTHGTLEHWNTGTLEQSIRNKKHELPKLH